MDSTDFHLRAAQGGDAEGLGRLYERLAPSLYAWARLRLQRRRTGAEPEDLMQEVWLRALRGFGTFEPRAPGSFRAWIFKIASNVYIEFMRRRRGAPTLDATAEAALLAQPGLFMRSRQAFRDCCSTACWRRHRPHSHPARADAK